MHYPHCHCEFLTPLCEVNRENEPKSHFVGRQALSPYGSLLAPDPAMQGLELAITNQIRRENISEKICRRKALSEELVSDGVNCNNVLWLGGIVFELFPQGEYIVVNSSCCNVHFISPYIIQKLVS